MAEIEGNDDFQQMLTKLKQRVNNIAAVKATVATADTGGDIKELLTGFTETLKQGFTALLDDKSGQLERLGAVAAGAAESAAAKKAVDSTAAELKKEINSTLTTLLSDLNNRLEGTLKDNIRNASMSIKDEIASVKSGIPSIDINAIGSSVETLGNTLKQAVEQLKTVSVPSSGAMDGTAMKSLTQEIKLSVGEVVNTRLDTALAPLRGEISALKAVITTMKIEPYTSANSGMEFAKSNIDNIRNEFSGEIKEIRALIERENNMVKSQTLEFLGFITDTIVSLSGKIDSLLRQGGAVATTAARSQQQGRAAALPNIEAQITEEIKSGLQREIAPVMDGLVHIIRFLVALSKR
ncbi:hypothetical protein [Candidatus Magnetominusculus dajiuhuensis]|uniref:hypothetical protein n=1 Tax=Candidatus Magnetominusculus dajiuhuensis TaxID=3137712 RepID=UPI003B439AC0